MTSTLWIKVNTVCRLCSSSRKARAGGSASLVLRHLPEPFAVANPPTDFQQGLGRRVHVQNALGVLGLGKKGRMGVFSDQNQAVTSCCCQVYQRGISYCRHKGNVVEALPRAPLSAPAPGCHRWEVTRRRGPNGDSSSNPGTRRNPRPSSSCRQVPTPPGSHLPGVVLSTKLPPTGIPLASNGCWKQTGINHLQMEE